MQTEPKKSEDSKIKNVWKQNVEEEMKIISNLIEEGYTWIAMDTEFPGILYNYVIDNNHPEMGYRILKMNVDSLKLIQAGISLARENGEKPKNTHTWQFNINFNLKKEKYHPESISLLKDAGIDFDELEENGIDFMVFGDLLMSSGLVINPNVYWITFHGTYDFSYLLKVLINNVLPNTSKEFLTYLKHVFPNIYDIKTMINELDELKNHSLSKLGVEIGIERFGIQHQAGSDALLTLELFFKIVRIHFFKGIPSKYYNNIFGISQEGGFVHYQGGHELAMNQMNHQGYTQYYGGFHYYNDNFYNPMENFGYPQHPQQNNNNYFNQQQQRGPFPR